MRIISGKFRGKKIDFVPSDDTRETQDKIRGAIFNSITPYMHNGVVLDLFAGSGAMALEALSRYEKMAYLNDINPLAIKTIKANIASMKLDNYKLYNLDYKACLDELKNVKFDIIFLDPPYKLNVIDDIIEYVINNNMLNDGGIIVCEYEFEIENHNLNVIKYKKYGYKTVKIFKKEG